MISKGTQQCSFIHLLLLGNCFLGPWAHGQSDSVVVAPLLLPVIGGGEGLGLFIGDLARKVRCGGSPLGSFWGEVSCANKETQEQAVP